MLSAKSQICSWTGKPTHNYSGETGAGAIWERQRGNAVQAEGPWKHCFGEAWHLLRTSQGWHGVTILGGASFQHATALCHNNIPPLNNMLIGYCSGLCCRMIIAHQYTVSRDCLLLSTNQYSDGVQQHLKIDSAQEIWHVDRQLQIGARPRHW